MTQAPAPVAEAERADVLDALRAFALLGILVSHVPDFTGYSFLSAAQRALLDPLGVDPTVSAWLVLIIREKFVPALDAAGSSLRNAVKAQVYLRHIEDTPHFLDVWESHFGARQCALTIVPTNAFGLVPGNIEINLIALTNNASTKKQAMRGAATRQRTEIRMVTYRSRAS